MTTLEKVNQDLNPDVEVRRWRGRRLFVDANWIVRVRTGKAQTMQDGSYWDGWENVGHYKNISDAAAAAYEVTGAR